MSFSSFRLVAVALAAWLALDFPAATCQAAPPFPARPTYRVFPSMRGTPFSYQQAPFYYRTLSLGLQTTVVAPDGGSALVGGYSSMQEGRNEFGAPLVGKVPFLNRGVNNVGYGRSMQSARVTVRVRIISLEEEEARQTGVGR